MSSGEVGTRTLVCLSFTPPLIARIKGGRAIRYALIALPCASGLRQNRSMLTHQAEKFIHSINTMKTYCRGKGR